MTLWERFKLWLRPPYPGPELVDWRKVSVATVGWRGNLHELCAFITARVGDRCEMTIEAVADGVCRVRIERIGRPPSTCPRCGSNMRPRANERPLSPPNHWSN